MTSQTNNLGLDLLAAEQAQKHVTLNEALLKLDAIVQLAVISRSHTAPPADPEEGDRYMPASGATGLWDGKAGAIAVYSGQVWNFIAPKAGFIMRVNDENRFLVHDGSDWQDLGASIAELHNMTRLGVGTSADSNNPFSAKLNNALWTANTVPEGGTGDMRFVMNKQSAAHTLSLLLQSDYTGHAEIGLVGENHLSLKTSANGVAWKTALTADSHTGMVSFPQGIGNVFGSSNMPNGLKPTNANTISNDWNDIKELGFYYGSNTMVNSPFSSGGCWCTVIPAIAGQILQIFERYSSSQVDAQAFRRVFNGTTWTDPLQTSWGNTLGLTCTWSNATAAASYSRVYKTAVDALSFDNMHSSNSYMFFNPLTSSGTGNCAVGFGRLTNTTSASGVQFIGYIGNNTNVIDFNFRTGASAVSFVCSNGGNFAIGTTAAPDKLTVAGNITPATDNAHSLGVAARRFSVVYAATGTINTSDLRVKTDIQECDLGLDFIKALQPSSFKRLDGETLIEHVDVQVGEEPEVVRQWDEKIGEDEDGAPITEKRQETRMVPTWGKEERPCGIREGVRTHYGFIAQQVKETVDAFGVTDFAGHTLADKNDPDSLQGLRHDQLLAPMVKAIQELSAIVELMQDRLDARGQ